MKQILAWFEDTPSPNEGRIQELRDAIAKGSYPSKKMVRQSAEEIILRFQGKSKGL
jgi:hypothetical protein